METSWTITPGATVEVVTLARAKEHLRVEHTAEDEYIGTLIKAAVQAVENETHTKITPHDVVENFSRFWMPLKLRWSPVLSIDKVEYHDTEGTFLEWSADQYIKTMEPAPAQIHRAPDGTIPAHQVRADGVRVTYQCGYSSTENIPYDIKSAILLILGHMYENREDTPKRIPTAASHLLNPYRVFLWRV